MGPAICAAGIDDAGYPISAVPHDTPRGPAGPLVLPGTYTVRLTVGTQIAEAPLEVKLDPRLTTTPAALRQQLEIERDLVALLTESSAAVSSARAIREKVEKLSPLAKGRLAKSVSAFGEIVTAALEGSKSGEATPRAKGIEGLRGDAQSLYDAIGQTDVGPTSAQTAAASRVEHDLRAALEGWRAIFVDLAALNRRIHSAGLPEIPPDAKPTGPPEAQNEE